MKNRLALVILDGWGIGDKSQSDAIFHANTPFMDHLMANYPNATLKTFGEEVGLPEGQMGNSEVGHMNIGAGRVVYQVLTRINKAIREGEFHENKILTEAFDKTLKEDKAVHLMGLLSDGGVHSHYEHLFALIDLALARGLQKIFIHAFTDGRDCDPKSALQFIQLLLEKIKNTPVKIATVSGRYFAMDRDNRWDRIAKCYKAMVNSEGVKTENVYETILENYGRNVTDEFLEPLVVCENNMPVAKMEMGDTVVSFNFRTDRPREITIALTQHEFKELEMFPLELNYLTMTSYDPNFSNVQVIFEKDNLRNTLGEVLSASQRTQVRAAETEKYPHVTFFFSGGREDLFEGESRILVNSPKVATYDLLPQMSAIELKEKTIDIIETELPDFVCLNFANPDMVGHTGVYSAIVTAVETVDSCLKELVESGLKQGYEFFIIADHGNADYALNPDGTPNTAHSLNPVPFIFVSENNCYKLSNGKLADVAPSILRRMKIAAPLEMSGENLIEVVYPN